MMNGHDLSGPTRKPTVTRLINAFTVPFFTAHSSALPIRGPADAAEDVDVAMYLQVESLAVDVSSVHF